MSCVIPSFLSPGSGDIHDGQIFLVINGGRPGSESDIRLLPGMEHNPDPGRSLNPEVVTSRKYPPDPGVMEGWSQQRLFQPPIPRFSGPDDTVSRKYDTIVLEGVHFISRLADFFLSMPENGGLLH